MMKIFKKKHDTLLIALIVALIVCMIGSLLVCFDGVELGLISYLLIIILFVQIITVIFNNHFYITLYKGLVSINYPFCKKLNKSFHLSELDMFKIVTDNKTPGVIIEIKKGGYRFSKVSFLIGNKNAEMLKQELKTMSDIQL